MATIRDKIRDLSQGRAILIDDTLTVVATRRLTPGFQRVTLHGACLSKYTQVAAADAFKIDIPHPATGETLRRGFTIRNFDPNTLTFDFDIALHTGGPSSDWSQNLRGGEVVPFLGFRRDFAIGDNITEHVIITDASGLPAVASILGAIPTHHNVTLIAETTHLADQALLDHAISASNATTGPTLNARWITGKPSIGPDSPLAHAALSASFPEGSQVWLAAESSTVRAMRRHILDTVGIPRANLHATAYWIHGLTSTDRDNRDATTYGNAVASGLDVMDPAVYDSLEFEDAISV